MSSDEMRKILRRVQRPDPAVKAESAQFGNAVPIPALATGADSVFQRTLLDCRFLQPDQPIPIAHSPPVIDAILRNIANSREKALERIRFLARPLRHQAESLRREPPAFAPGWVGVDIPRRMGGDSGELKVSVYIKNFHVSFIRPKLVSIGFDAFVQLFNYLAIIYFVTTCIL